jgi:hypothetical protein
VTHAASPVSVTSVSRFCLCNRSDSRACRTGGAGRGREATPSASSLRAKNANVNGQENLETSRRPMHFECATFVNVESYAALTAVRRV